MIEYVATLIQQAADALFMPWLLVLLFGALQIVPNLVGVIGLSGFAARVALGRCISHDAITARE